MDNPIKILSLGAGVQSSTIFLMSCFGEIEKIDAAMFADTGWEPRAVYEWLKFLKKEGLRYGVPIYEVSQGNLKNDALVSQVRGVKAAGKRWASLPFFTLGPSGERGMIRRQCTYEYKIRPLQKKQRELAGYKPRQRIPAGTVELWKGISLDEIKRAVMSRDKWVENYYPLIELRMTRHDCLLWFEKKGLPRPPRSSCIGCPYHHNNEWRQMRDNYPDEWQEAVAFDKAIRKCGGMRGDVFIHADRVPLDEVDLSTPEERGQLNWLDECVGVCGV